MKIVFYFRPIKQQYFLSTVSTSFIYSEVIDLPEWMSYGKLRAGWGNVGGALPDAYALALTYTAPDGGGHGFSGTANFRG